MSIFASTLIAFPPALSTALDELAQAFAQPADRLVINMIGDGPPLVLDPKQVEAARERIRSRYNVVREENLQEQPSAKTTAMQTNL